MNEVPTLLTKEMLIEQITKLADQYEKETHLVAGVILIPDASKPTEVLEWTGERFLKRDCNIRFATADKQSNSDLRDRYPSTCEIELRSLNS
jgi:hypothetical protein